jgi:hypothetical protein
MSLFNKSIIVIPTIIGKPKQKNFCTSQKNTRIANKPQPPIKKAKFLNQTIVDLVKSFIRENKPDQAIEILEAVGFGDGLAEFFVSAIKTGVLV